MTGTGPGDCWDQGNWFLVSCRCADHFLLQRGLQGPANMLVFTVLEDLLFLLLLLYYSDSQATEQ